MKKILSIGGSNSSQSINNQLSKYAGDLANGVEVSHVNLGAVNVPMYGMDLEKEQGIPTEITDLLQKFEAYDGFILSSPEHNGSIPAFLKNILDWFFSYRCKGFWRKTNSPDWNLTGKRWRSQKPGMAQCLYPVLGWCFHREI